MRLKINTKAKLSSVCEAACILIVVGGILAGYSEELERITDWSIVILGIFVLIYTLLNNRIKTIELLPMILCLALGLVNCIFIHQNALQIYIIISCAYYPVALFLLHSKELHTGWWAAYAVLPSLCFTGLILLMATFCFIKQVETMYQCSYWKLRFF